MGVGCISDKEAGQYAVRYLYLYAIIFGMSTEFLAIKRYANKSSFLWHISGLTINFCMVDEF